jgi:hypothetical protein
VLDEVRVWLAWRKFRSNFRMATEMRRKGMKSWKTTLCGAIAAFILAVRSVLPEWLQPLAEPAAGFITALGLVVAKDHDK